MAHKVFVGLSGGVDSALSAALLKERGFDVTGAFIKIWKPEFIECTWKEDRLDAMRVCAALSIPYREIDLSDEYKRDVVAEMISGYARGYTPNPDVLCNASIKFGPFAAWAKASGADFIATGHYARIRQRGGHFELLRGVDTEKDQSYFLYQLGQRHLARAVFPVGGMQKKDVREAAQRLHLPVAGKRDSQGLCFIGDVSMKDFLRRFIPLAEGPVVDTQGREIGRHEGACLVTVGQRHGFSLEEARQPHYVVDIDTTTNTLTVSEDRADAERTETGTTRLSWVHRAPRYGSLVQAQARYREKPFAVRLHALRDKVRVESAEPHVFPPGQSIVFYEGDVCLGGGIIEKAEAPRGSDSALHSGAAAGARVVQVQ